MIWILALLFTVPLPNATVTFQPGGSATTDAQGIYRIQVHTPWNGSITAAYPGCAITPVIITAGNVVMDSQVVDFICRDVQSPEAQITAPKNNGTISRNANLTVTASDNIAVVRVIWSLDGNPIGTVTVAPWGLRYTFGRLTAWHMLTAQAFDSSGNQATSSVRFRVK